jgi:hypothetical protein
MNIIKITLCISVFVFSLTAFALENQESPQNGTHIQMPVVNQVAFHQDDREGTLMGTDDVHQHIMTQSPIETPDVSLFTKLCIFLSISMVYWIYWLINTRTYKMKQ